MRKAFGAVLGAMGLAAALLSGPAAAQEESPLTLVLTNELKDLHPDVNAVRVSCAVCPTEKCTAESPDRIGTGGESVATNGAASFSSRITVPILFRDAQGGRSDPLQAQAWACKLELVSARGPALEPSEKFTEAAELFARAREGTQLVTRLGGPIRQ
jgi:hypothetical protein